MIYELRLYSVALGRMSDVHARFANHLPKLFERHGVKCIGRWAATSGPRSPQFVYLLAYKDYSEREASWASFYADAEWWRVRAETNAGSEMIERYDLFFLKKNPVWNPSEDDGKKPAGAIAEMMMQQTAIGQTAAVNEFLGNFYLPLLQESGATVAAVLDVASGHNLPQTMVMLSWRDANARAEAWRSMERSGHLAGRLSEQRKSFGRSLFGPSDTYLLEANAS